MIFLTKRVVVSSNKGRERWAACHREDLSAERLLLAYRSGIFPWFIENGLPFWFSPDPRFVLFPEDIHVSHSMRQLTKQLMKQMTKQDLNSQRFKIIENTNFRKVIESCALVHQFKTGSTWISHEFIESYHQLHKMGVAKSIEVWEKDTLVGGLYGVEIGTVFCGKSMFSFQPNVSKLALIHLCNSGKYSLIDCQMHTPHLESMGAKWMSRK